MGNYKKKTFAKRKGGKKFEKSEKGDRDFVPKFQENDWTWYAANEQILKDAASIQFSNALGLPVDYGIATNTPFLNQIPGIMTLEMIQSVGHSEDPSSAVNVGAKNINSWVRHANSGSRNYESSDLMMTILATSGVYAYIAFLERLYGLARVYSQQNRYMAKALIASQVGDTIADSIIENLADFRYYINNAIIKASTLKIPKGLSVVDRHIWLNSHVWADDTSAKAQVYIPLIKYFYKYNPTKFTTGGSLEYTTFLTVGDYKALFVSLNQMIDVLIRDDDCNTIWGDIVKAYGDEGCYKLISLPEEYAVIPEYSEEVLMQIENSTIFRGFTFVGGMDAVAQYNNYIISTPEAYFTEANPASNFGDYVSQGFSKLILNIAHDNPDIKDNIVATRLMAMTDGSSIATGLTSAQIGTLANANGQLHFDFGTELIVHASVFLDPNLSSVNTSIFTFVNVGAMLSETVGYLGYLVTKFKYMPHIYMFSDVATPGTFEFVGYLGAADNYTDLTYNNVFKLNTTALLNEFAVPQLGVVKR